MNLSVVFDRRATTKAKKKRKQKIVWAKQWTCRAERKAKKKKRKRRRTETLLASMSMDVHRKCFNSDFVHDYDDDDDEEGNSGSGNRITILKYDTTFLVHLPMIITMTTPLSLCFICACIWLVSLKRFNNKLDYFRVFVIFHSFYYYWFDRNDIVTLATHSASSDTVGTMTVKKKKKTRKRNAFASQWNRNQNRNDKMISSRHFGDRQN